MLHEHGHHGPPQVHRGSIAVRPSVVVLKNGKLNGVLLVLIVKLVYATTLAETLSEVILGGVMLEDVKGVFGHHFGNLRRGIGYDWYNRMAGSVVMS